MPLFFFHLISPGTYAADDVGNDFPDVETAYLFAHSSALEIAFEFLREGRDPAHHQFHISDDQGRFLMELPFSEVINPSSRPASNLAIRLALRQTINQSQQLQNQIRAEFSQTRIVLENARATLKRARACT